MSAGSARRSRLAKRARGECERCVEPAAAGVTLCEAHRVSRRDYCVAWRRGEHRPPSTLPRAMLVAWAEQAVAEFALREPLWAAALRARGQDVDATESRRSR